MDMVVNLGLERGVACLQADPAARDGPMTHVVMTGHRRQEHGGHMQACKV